MAKGDVFTEVNSTTDARGHPRLILEGPDGNRYVARKLSYRQLREIVIREIRDEHIAREAEGLTIINVGGY